jgi:RNA polymerase sigma-70 factor (ECF subfamily)
MPPISSNPERGRSEDAALVARARAGDGAAFDALVGRYQDRVFNMALRMRHHREDALDTAQEIFLPVYRSIARFEEKARFSTWLYRIVVNRCRDELRRRGTVKHTRPRSLDARRPGDEERNPEPASPAASPADHAAARELEGHVEAAVAALPGEAREVLLLRDAEDLSYEEIADVLGVPVGTVRSRLNRARVLVRDRIQPILGEGA